MSQHGHILQGGLGPGHAVCQRQTAPSVCIGVGSEGSESLLSKEASTFIVWSWRLNLATGSP